jgi:Flp pilus assembly protein TadB
MMKQVRFTLLMIFGAFLFLQPAHAAIMTRTESTEVVEKQNKELKKEFKVQKKMNKLQKILKKFKIDLSDSTEKWMWFWIFGWAAAIILSIVAVATVSTTASVTGFGLLYLLATLCGLFGSISLIIWLVKKFSK